MFQAGFRVGRHTPELAPYLERSAGLLVLCGLYLASSGTPQRRVSISISDLARRFLVSRAHVRSLLDAAAEGGLIEHPSGDTNSLLILPRLADAFETLSGSVFVFLGQVSRAVLGSSRATSVSFAANRRHISHRPRPPEPRVARQTGPQPQVDGSGPLSAGTRAGSAAFDHALNPAATVARQAQCAGRQT